MNQEQSGAVAQFERFGQEIPRGLPILPGKGASPPGTCLQEARLQRDLLAVGDLTSVFPRRIFTVVSIYMMLPTH